MTKTHTQHGMALLEVLVSLTLFSLGVLGLVAVHAKAAQYSVDSEDRSRAAMLASQLASYMWAQNTLSIDSTTYATWQTAVADTTDGGLPNGSGSYTVTNSVAKITITWKAPWKTSSEQSNEYVTNVVIP